MGGISGWFGDNWFNLVQSGSIVAGFVCAALSLQRDAQARRGGNLLAVTQAHRELWAEVYRRPELARVLDATVDLAGQPVSHEEDLFVRLIVVHLSTTWRLIHDGLPLSLEAVREDVRALFSLPIPREVWSRVREVQAPDFRAFVETCLAIQ